jgi:U3 small nucleolar RNA-associated protein 19
VLRGAGGPDGANSDSQNAALTLLMRLLKDEGAHLKPDGEDYYFPHDTFGRIVSAALSAEHLDEEVKAELAKKYINCYDDVRYSFFTAMKYVSPRF